LAHELEGRVRNEIGAVNGDPRKLIGGGDEQVLNLTGGDALPGNGAVARQRRFRLPDLKIQPIGTSTSSSSWTLIELRTVMGVIEEVGAGFLGDLYKIRAIPLRISGAIPEFFRLPVRAKTVIRVGDSPWLYPLQQSQLQPEYPGEMGPGRPAGGPVGGRTSGSARRERPGHEP
jgi:hypothetical protein